MASSRRATVDGIFVITDIRGDGPDGIDEGDLVDVTGVIDDFNGLGELDLLESGSYTVVGTHGPMTSTMPPRSSTSFTSDTRRWCPGAR